jgi:hypothetical protein
MKMATAGVLHLSVLHGVREFGSWFTIHEKYKRSEE